MKLQQDDRNLVSFDIDNQPFKTLAAQIKYTLAYYRCSNECIEHVFKHFTEAEVADAIDGLGNPLDYEAEPDHRLLEMLKLLTGVPYPKMPPCIPNNHLKLIKKSDLAVAKINLEKIRQMMINKGIIVT